MKRNRKIASAILLLSFAVTSLLPQASFANESNAVANSAAVNPAALGTVTFVTQDGERQVQFDSLEEPINKTDATGAKADESDGENPKAYFIAWSTVENYDGTQEGAKAFYGTEPIKNAFPDGIPQDAKLYASYLTADKAMALAGFLRGDITINSLVPDSDAHYNLFPVKEGKGDANNNQITYTIGDNVAEKNNFKLGATFKYNPFVNEVVRRSPGRYFAPGSAQYYGNRGDAQQTSTSKDVNETQYTFVDLHIKVDERVTLADVLNFQFKSYAWKPLMILTRDYEKIADANIVVDPASAVSDITLPTAQVVAKDGTKEFLIRTVIRGFEPGQPVTPAASYQEANVENDMELISTNENNFSLSKEVIEAIADKTANPVVIKGEIKGGAKLYRLQLGDAVFGGPTEIPVTEAKAVLFNYERDDVGRASNLNLIFYRDIGVVHYQEEIKKGESLKNPLIAPTKEGYIFKGWSKDSNAKVPDPIQPKASDKYNESTTFYAVWEKAVVSGGGGGGAVPVPTPSTPSKTPEALNSVDHMHYIVGYPDSTVRPNKNITRAEITSVYYRLLNDKKRDEIFTKVNGFKDVKVTNWYNKAVSSMTNGKYISGYPDGTFGGNKPMTRAEFVAVTARFLDKKASNKTFVDVKENHWAKEAISAGAAYGWLSGYEDGTFRPDQAITRAEAMAIINRLLDRGVDENGLKQVDYKKWVDNEKGKWYYYEVIEATNDHKYTGKRPNEVWTSLKIERVYDYDKYEKPGK